jgi:hypothetical protein
VRRWNFHLADHRFRSRRFALAKPAGARRVIALGGSSTWALGLPAGQDYPTLMEGLLNETGGPPFEVLNAAFPAAVSSRLYRVPSLAALPAMDMWARCEWWVFHGLGAADAVHELVSGEDLSKEDPQVPEPPYQRGTDPGTLAERCPVDWAFVHHALLVMAHDLAEELADEPPQVKPELPAIRDAAVKPLVYLGFGIGLEAQGI